MKKTVIIILTLLFVFQPIFADAIFKKNGEVIEGKIVSETQLEIGIKTSDKSFFVKKDEIERLVYSPADEKKSFIDWPIVIPGVICAALFLFVLFWHQTL